MTKLSLIAGALLMSALLVPGAAEAQRHGFGGGFRGGAPRVGGGGFGGVGAQRMYIPRAGVRTTGAIAARPGAFPARSVAVGAGAGAFRRAAVVNPGGRFDYRPGYRRYPYYGRYGHYPYYGRYPYYRRNYGNYYGGLGVGLVTGSLLGAAATYPYYNYPYQTPYPYQTSAAIGGYCATPVVTCALTSPAALGTGCSCRAPGGRARGNVVGP